MLYSFTPLQCALRPIQYPLECKGLGLPVGDDSGKLKKAGRGCILLAAILLQTPLAWNANTKQIIESPGGPSSEA